jgi:hypothetical protein
MPTRCLLAVLLLSGLAQAQPTITPAEIAPGMKGYGLTVFHGTTIERFDVEAMGVLPFADLDDSWIMIRITSGPVATRGSGIVAGMSGSPVYFDGRLAGAVAFGFTFAKEPVGFLQPIGSMMRALDLAAKPLPKRSASAAADAPVAGGESHALTRPVMIDGRACDRVRVSPTRLAAGYRPPEGELTVEPLATPVLVSGLGTAGAEALRPLLAPYHLDVVAAPSGKAEGPVELAPGAALAIPMVTGDIQAAGTGTVTWREGNRVLGFGHPMLQRNRVNLPICGARIVDFINDLDRSFKLAAPADICGALQADSRWGVAGEIGPAPEMIPVTVRLSDPDSGLQRTVHFKVLDDSMMTPLLAFALTRELVSGEMGDASHATFRSETRIDFAGQAPLVQHQSGYVPSGPPLAALQDVMGAAQLMLASPFEELDLRSLDVSVELQHADRTASITRAAIATPVVKPGETFELSLELRRHGDSGTQRQTVRLPIPARLAPGHYRLGVAGGPALANLDAQLGLLPAPPHNTAQLLARLRELDGDPYALSAKLVLTAPDVLLRGERLPQPPANVEQLLTRTQSLDVVRGRTALVVSQPLDLLLTNGLVAEVLVADPLTGEVPRAEPGQAAPSPGGGPIGPGGPGARPAPGEPVLISGPAPMLDDPLGSCWQPPLWLDAETGRARPVFRLDLDPAQDGPTFPRRPRPSVIRGDSGPAAGPAPGAPTAGPPAPAAAAPHGPRTWLTATPKEWAAGDGQNVALRPDGGLMLAAACQDLGAGLEPHLWGGDLDHAGIAWLASSNAGELLKSAEGRLTPAWHGEGSMVSAVAATADGVVFATAPDGKLRRLAGDGKAAELGPSGSTYVWKLRTAKDGSVLAACGRPARLVRISGDKIESLDTENIDHLLCLAEGPDGAIYYGGGLPGRVVRRGADGSTVVAGAAEAVSALAVSPEGVVFYGAGSQLACLAPNGARRGLGPTATPCCGSGRRAARRPWPSSSARRRPSPHWRRPPTGRSC